MTIRNQPIRIINVNHISPSFYPSQYASFCEMGRLSDLIFNNRISNQNNNNNNKINNDDQDTKTSKYKANKKESDKDLFNDDLSLNNRNPNSSEDYSDNNSISYKYD